MHRRQSNKPQTRKYDENRAAAIKDIKALNATAEPGTMRDSSMVMPSVVRMALIGSALFVSYERVRTHDFLGIFFN